ncbi:hypothetical protein C8R47DRAFT_1154523 [Mycena vitilis]|nr:hypothetical protein C8R47DRAFT_1154523 [Mycena vitilis]
MMRFALRHNDPRPPNIMLDETSGEVLGIVDWEFYGFVPACLSVPYPSWVRSVIDDSPEYHNPKSTIISIFLEGRAERNKLSDFYEDTVRDLDEEYHTCLMEGARLRDAFAWIENSRTDGDGFAMARWVEDHLFSDAVDIDHRCA